MASVLEARNRFQVGQFTLDWIDGVEWQIKDVVAPFTDACDYTKVRTQVCYLFDPLQQKGNLATLTSSVQCVIEPLVGLNDKVTYKEIDWCTQKDSRSCGVWCLVMLELQLADRSWADSHYEVQSYLRMRYLYKEIGVQ